MEWECYFKPWILERGKECFEEGLVRIVSKDAHRAVAAVSGTAEYEVTVEYDEEEVTDMSCSCPYAEKGHSCKHMAALLYALEEGEADDSSFVDAIPEEDLRALVREYAAKDRAFRGFLLEGRAEPQMKPMRQGLVLFEEILSELSEGEAERPLKELRELAASSDPESRAVMVIRLSDWMEENQSLEAMREIEETVLECFSDEPQRLLEYVDGRLLDPSAPKLDLYVPAKLRLLKAIGMEDRFVSPFRREHLDIPEALEDEAEYLARCGRKEEAEALLEERGAKAEGLS